VLFNEALHPSMSFYNITLKSRDLANVISDCYLELGRRATIELLDRMKEFGFQESTRSGISFATSDLVTASNKEKVISGAEAQVLKLQKSYDRGLMTSGERYNKVIDVWTHAREEITEAMRVELEHDLREDGAYVNPIHLMADSGAAASVTRNVATMVGPVGAASHTAGSSVISDSTSPLCSRSAGRGGSAAWSSAPRSVSRSSCWSVGSAAAAPVLRHTPSISNTAPAAPPALPRFVNRTPPVMASPHADNGTVSPTTINHTSPSATATPRPSPP
jgi:hypothetical protein